MTEAEIKIGIDYWISQLKSDIRSKFVYVFRKHPSREDAGLLHGDNGHLMGAVTNGAFKPPVVTFYQDVIAEHYKSKDELKSLVTHEVLHVCGFGHGPLMDEKMFKNRLFREAGERVYRNVFEVPKRPWFTMFIMNLLIWWILTSGTIKK